MTFSSYRDAAYISLCDDVHVKRQSADSHVTVQQDQSDMLSTVVAVKNTQSGFLNYKWLQITHLTSIQLHQVIPAVSPLNNIHISGTDGPLLTGC